MLESATARCVRPTAVVALLLASILFAAWADVRAQSAANSATPALISAVRAADLAAVRFLLAEPVDVNAPQPDAATALHWAVHREHLEITDLLIAAGADIDAANDLGVTPLLMACARGYGVLVESLLAAGADPNAALKSGETALMAASRAGSLDAVNATAGVRVNTTESTRGQVGPDVGGREPASGDHAGAHRARGGRRSPEQDPAPGLQRGRQPVRRLGVARHLARRSGRRRQHGATVPRAVG